MIKNERQYRITTAQAQKLAAALDAARKRPAGSKLHPLLRKAEAEGLQNQIDDLRAQLKTFESLRKSHRKSQAPK